MTLIATTRKLILYPGNTQGVTLLGVQDQTTNQFWGASAVIVGTLQDNNGTNIVEVIQVPFVYQVGTQGNFLAVFGDSSFLPPPGNNYTFIVDGQQGSAFLHLEILTEVRPRQY